MASRVRRMTAAQVERLLARHRFSLVSQRGSHRKWRNSARNLLVIVPEHGGRELPLGTLRNIMVNADIPVDEWQV